MRVLVTGHLGYIGTVMAPMLLQAGHSVIGVDSDIYERCSYQPGGAIVSVPSLRKDVRDLELYDLQGFDACIHLAALSNDPLSDLNPDITYAINHRGSARLATLCKEAGVRRFLFASSCSNYGAAGDDVIDETGTLNPVTAYGQSKVWSERDISPLAGGDGKDLPSVRRFAVATDCPHTRYRAGFHCGFGRQAGGCGESGIQCRTVRSELPNHRYRRSRGSGGPELPYRGCTRSGA